MRKDPESPARATLSGSPNLSSTTLRVLSAQLLEAATLQDTWNQGSDIPLGRYTPKQGSPLYKMSHTLEGLGDLNDILITCVEDNRARDLTVGDRLMFLDGSSYVIGTVRCNDGVWSLETTDWTYTVVPTPEGYTVGTAFDSRMVIGAICE